MKLATISEKTASDNGDQSADITMPRTWREADRLFDEAMAASESGDRELAYNIFKRLADYNGEGPSELRGSARKLRDFYAPDASPEARARMIRREMPAHFYSIDIKKGTVAHWKESRDREHAGSGRATLQLDPPTLAWIVENDLIASAFRAFERGDLDEADRIFADFLLRTKEAPSTALRATAMLARQAIAAKRSEVREVKPDEITMPYLRSFIDLTDSD